MINADNVGFSITKIRILNAKIARERMPHMLVLSRRTNEKIVLPELAVAVQVVAIKPGTVRLGIDAPREVTVLREEVAERDSQWHKPPAAAADRKLAQLRELVEKRLKVSALGLALLREQLRARKTRDATELVEFEFVLMRESVGGLASGRSWGILRSSAGGLLIHFCTRC